MEPIPEYRKDDLWNVVNRLLNIPIPEKPVVVEMDRTSSLLSEQFFYEVDREILEAPSPELRAWIGKLHGNTLRIALVLHCIHYLEDFGNHEVDEGTMRNAIEIGRYFLEEAKEAFKEAGLCDPPDVKDAKYILKQLDATGKTEIKLRDLQQMCKNRKGLENKEDMIPGINCLIEHGYIRVEKVVPTSQNSQNPQKGGRPSEIVYVNPEYIRHKEQEGRKQV